MARYVATVHSPRTPEEAFTFLADLRNFRRWDPGVKDVSQVAGDGPGPGAEYDVTVTGTTLRYRIAEYSPPKSFLAVASTRRLTSHDRVSVFARDDGCMCAYDATVTLHGPLRVLDPLFALVFRRMGARAARGLAQALDAREWSGSLRRGGG